MIAITNLTQPISDEFLVTHAGRGVAKFLKSRVVSRVRTSETSMQVSIREVMFKGRECDGFYFVQGTVPVHKQALLVYLPDNGDLICLNRAYLDPETGISHVFAPDHKSSESVTVLTIALSQPSECNIPDRMTQEVYVNGKVAGILLSTCLGVPVYTVAYHAGTDLEVAQVVNMLIGTQVHEVNLPIEEVIAITYGSVS